MRCTAGPHRQIIKLGGLYLRYEVGTLENDNGPMANGYLSGRPVSATVY